MCKRCTCAVHHSPSICRDRAHSLEAGQILSRARLSVIELLGNDNNRPELGREDLERLVLDIWSSMGSVEPAPDATMIVDAIIREFADSNSMVPMDDLQIDHVLHHIFSHIMLDVEVNNTCTDDSM